MDDNDDDLHPVVGGSSSSSNSGEGVEDPLAALAALADATASSKPAPQRVRRRASLSDMTPPPSSSLLNRAHRRPSCASLDGWVAHGVDFSSSVEVYVFRT